MAKEARQAIENCPAFGVPFEHSRKRTSVHWAEAPECTWPWILPNQNRRLEHIKDNVDFLSKLFQLAFGGDNRTNPIICQKDLLMSSPLIRLQIPLIQQRSKVALLYAAPLMDTNGLKYIGAGNRFNLLKIGEDGDIDHWLTLDRVVSLPATCVEPCQLYSQQLRRHT